MKSGAVPSPTALKGFRILLVDDEEGILDALQLAFGTDNAVYTATSGAEALALLERETVDVVLLDLRMSGILDGVQTLAHIKKRLPDLPVIIHSAYLTEKMPELALADDFVVKPGGLAQLRRVLHWYASVGNLKRDQAKA